MGRCPEALHRIIAKANLIKADTEDLRAEFHTFLGLNKPDNKAALEAALASMDLQEIESVAAPVKRKRGERRHEPELVARFRKESALRKYFDKELERHGLSRWGANIFVAGNYLRFYEWRRNLEILARAVSNWEAGLPRIEIDDSWPGGERVTLTGRYPQRELSFSYTGEKYLDQNCEVRDDKDALSRALDLARSIRGLRICKNDRCSLVFWASRKNKVFCDDKCGDAYRRRQSRIEEAVTESRAKSKAIKKRGNLWQDKSSNAGQTRQAEIKAKMSG